MSTIIGNNHFSGNFHEIEYTMQNLKKYPWVLTSYLLRQYTTYLPMYCTMKLTCFSVDRTHRLWSMICPCLVPLSTNDPMEPMMWFLSPFIHDFPMVVPLIFRAAESRGGCALDAAVRSTSWRLWSKCVATRISGNHKRSGAPVR